MARSNSPSRRAGRPFDDEEIGPLTWGVWMKKTVGTPRTYRKLMSLGVGVRQASTSNFELRTTDLRRSGTMLATVLLSSGLR